MDNYLILAKRKASCPDRRPEACLCQVRASSEQEAVRNACRLVNYLPPIEAGACRQG